MNQKILLLLGLSLVVAGCGDDEPASGKDAGGERDANITEPRDDAASDEDAGTCPSGGGDGTLKVDIELETGVEADVRILRGSEAVGDVISASTARMLSAGTYRITLRRVRKAGTLAGPAYQGSLPGGAEICVHAAKTTSVRVVYAREPGSERLWLTQSNGDGAQVMAFDADQLNTLGEQTPSVSLSPKLNSVGPIRVDGKGRLWVGTTTGKLVAYNSARLGSTSTSAPDIVLEGASICDDALPCGPRAIAFDAKGALWTATLHRVVKLAPESLNASGSPAAAVVINSPSTQSPRGLAFDVDGNLWVANAEGAVAKFDAARLTGNIDSAANVVIFAQQPGPVMIGLGEPEGIVFDPDGNLWIGYFGPNALVRFSKTELAASALADDPIIPTRYLKIGVEALVTDLALDEGGNLWLPGGAGYVYRIAKDQLSNETPTLGRLHSAEIGSVEKISFNTVPGPLFIAP
jgi:sugar lactone lactonase YvrE